MNAVSCVGLIVVLFGAVQYSLATWERNEGLEKVALAEMNRLAAEMFKSYNANEYKDLLADTLASHYAHNGSVTEKRNSLQIVRIKPNETFDADERFGPIVLLFEETYSEMAAKQIKEVLNDRKVSFGIKKLLTKNVAGFSIVCTSDAYFAKIICMAIAITIVPQGSKSYPCNYLQRPMIGNEWKELYELQKLADRKAVRFANSKTVPKSESPIVQDSTSAVFHFIVDKNEENWNDKYKLNLQKIVEFNGANGKALLSVRTQYLEQSFDGSQLIDSNVDHNVIIWKLELNDLRRPTNLDDSAKMIIDKRVELGINTGESKLLVEYVWGARILFVPANALKEAITKLKDEDIVGFCAKDFGNITVISAIIREKGMRRMVENLFHSTNFHPEAMARAAVLANSRGTIKPDKEFLYQEAINLGHESLLYFKNMVAAYRLPLGMSLGFTFGNGMIPLNFKLHEKRIWKTQVSCVYIRDSKDKFQIPKIQQLLRNEIIVSRDPFVGLHVPTFTKFQLQSLEAHNFYRSLHCQDNTKMMTLNEDLCVYAQNWANALAQRLQPMLNPHRNPKASLKEKSLGENIYQTTSDTDDGWDAVDAWYEEIENYFPEKAEGETGHFTQVLWNDSTELGVGKATGEDGWTYVVANYREAGNMTLNGKFLSDENVYTQNYILPKPVLRFRK